MQISCFGFRLIVFVCLATLGIYSNAQAQNPRADRFGVGIEVNLNATLGLDTIREISGVPLPERTVPVHPDDGTGNRVFTDETFPVSHGVRGGLTILPQVKIGRVKLKAGFAISSAASGPSIGSDLSELNYRGSGRTTGAALVYFSIATQGSWYAGPVLEAEVRVSRVIGIMAGYANFESPIGIETGWDRFNKLQPYRTYEIGKLKTDRISLGLVFNFGEESDPVDDLLSFHLGGGVMSPTFTPNAEYPSVIAQTRKSGFVDIGFSINLGTWQVWKL